MNKLLTMIAITDDISLSARLVKLCTENSYRLIFPDINELFKVCKDIRNGVIIVQLEMKDLRLSEISADLKNIRHITKIGYMNKIKNNVRKQALQCGIDMVFPVSGFIRNLSTLVKNLTPQDYD